MRLSKKRMSAILAALSIMRGRATMHHADEYLQADIQQAYNELRSEMTKKEAVYFNDLIQGIGIQISQLESLSTGTDFPRALALCCLGPITSHTETNGLE